MANYQTGKKMYSTLTEALKTSIKNKDINAFETGMLNILTEVYGKPKSKEGEEWFKDGFLGPYIDNMKRALDTFYKEPTSGAKLIAEAFTKARSVTVDAYLASVPTDKLSEEEQKGINIQKNLEKIIKELTQNQE